MRIKLKTPQAHTNSSQKWLLRQLNDPYVHKVKQHGYRSRAAFKLLEIDEKFHLLKSGSVIVDLGAAPGGWSQVAAQKIKPTKGGKIIAIDLLPIDPILDVTILCLNFMEETAPDQIQAHLTEKADILLSDMSPATCGIPNIDHIRIIALVEAAAEFAMHILKPGGAFVAKVFQGGTQAELLARLKQSFQKVQHFKPPASRKESAEIYLVAQGFRGNTTAYPNL